MDHIQYSDEDTSKVVAKLYSYNSQIYTKLAQKVQRIEQLEAEMKQLKEEVKASTRGDVADLFDAEDAVKTRVVETVSFIIQLSKDPKETVSPKYKDILEALSTHMTPELITMMESLKKQMVTVTQKSPSLKITPKEEPVTPLSEGRLGDWLSRFKSFVANWGASYDAKLARLKQAAIS
jgi:uncharacterized protein (UPF0335 family)